MAGVPRQVGGPKKRQERNRELRDKERHEVELSHPRRERDSQVQKTPIDEEEKVRKGKEKKKRKIR